MTEPLITIGITCFNAEDTIERAILSAIEQDYPQTEIIVVDDCSTDDSQNIIKKFENKNNIRFVQHKENQGVAATRNTIINSATGQYIAFFDDDDISSPKRIKVQYSKIIECEKKYSTELISCYASGYRVYENNYKYYFKAIGSQETVPKGRDLIQYQLFMTRPKNVFFGNGTPSCSMMIKNSVIKDIGLYDPMMKRIEDTDLALRLAEKNTYFIGCPEELVFQTATTGQDKSPIIGYDAEINLYKKHQGHFKPPRKYNFACNWSKLKLHHYSGKKVQAALQIIMLFLKYPIWSSHQFLQSVPSRIKHESMMGHKDES